MLSLSPFFLRRSENRAMKIQSLLLIKLSIEELNSFSKHLINTPINGKIFLVLTNKRVTQKSKCMLECCQAWNEDQN